MDQRIGRERSVALAPAAAPARPQRAGPRGTASLALGRGSGQIPGPHHQRSCLPDFRTHAPGDVMSSRLGLAQNLFKKVCKIF